MTLDEWLRKNQITDAAFARQSGIRFKQMIGRYRKGTCFPGPENLHRISVATNGNVTANDFVAQIASRTPEKSA